jgi:hypothetical protein
VRTIKTGVVAAIIIGLLAGSAVGVAAQDEKTAVEFTGATGFGPDFGSYNATPIVEPFTDPRLAGSFRTWGNSDAYPGGPTIFSGGFSMHDDEGGWIQRVVPGGAINHPDGTSAPRVIVMDGQEAYAGLTLVAAVSLANARWDWHGYIIDGELPPAPTIELPE